MAQWIKADGTTETVRAAGAKWSLEELQALVGGYIEKMPGVPFTMLMNEEGLLRDLPVNGTATMLVRKALAGQTLRYLPTIVGDVVVLEKGDRW